MYVPERGDIVWLEFDFQTGREQRGRRPAFVVSHRSYNERIGMALFCPVTSKTKGYPFEVPLEGKRISGCVLSDQVKSLDWRKRHIEFIEKLQTAHLKEVIDRIIVMIE
jgi:mRNA interferase MazF